MNYIDNIDVDEISKNIITDYQPRIVKFAYGKWSEISFFNRIVEAIDYYFGINSFESCQFLTDNEFVAKNTVVRYFKHPGYWADMQKLNTDFTIYTISIIDLLKYAKSIAFKYELGPYNKMYIKSKVTKYTDDGNPITVPAKIGLDVNTPEFKEFAKYINDKTNNKYDIQTLVFVYSTLLSDEELSAFSPATAAAMKKQAKTRKKEILAKSKELAKLKKLNKNKPKGENTKGSKVINDTPVQTPAKQPDNIDKSNAIEMLNTMSDNLHQNDEHSVDKSQCSVQLNEYTEVISRDENHNPAAHPKDLYIEMQNAISTKNSPICQGCPAVGCSNVLFNVDIPKNATNENIEILVIGDKPNSYDINSGVPFMGPGHKLLRVELNKLNVNIAYTNMILCDVTGEAKQELDSCINILHYTIKKLNPKYIIVSGNTALKSLCKNTIRTSTASNSMFKLFEFVLSDVTQPVFVTYGDKELTQERFQDNFKDSIKFIKESIFEDKMNAGIIRGHIVDDSSKAINMFEKIYDWNAVIEILRNGYKLGLVQTMYNQFEYSNAIMIAQFKRDDEVLVFDVTEIPYIYYYCNKQIDVDKRIGIEPIESPEFIEERSVSMKEVIYNPYGIIDHKQKPRFFESDIPTEDKFTTQCKLLMINDENIDFEQVIDVSPVVAYIDIEVYADEGFPKPEYAKKEINAVAYNISTSNMVKIIILSSEDIPKRLDIIDEKLKEAGLFGKIEYEIFVANTEHELLRVLDSFIFEDKPEIQTAWNAQFDFNYIMNRSRLMGYDDITLSPYGIRGYNSSKTSLYQPLGSIVLDLQDMYKASQRRAPRSMKLGYISQIELGITKIEFDGDLCELYDNDKHLYMAYNIFDVILIKMIDAKTQLMVQSVVLRAFQGSSFSGMDGTIMPFTTLSIRKARQDNVYIRSALHFAKKDGQYEGAMSITRRQGVFPLVTDFDQSLPGDQIISIKRNNNIFETSIGEYKFIEGDETLTKFNDEICYKPVKGKLIHKRKDPIYKITTTSGNSIKVTGGHSVIVFRDGKEIECKVIDIMKTDKLIKVVK